MIVFTNSCQALILLLPAVLHTPRFPCHCNADVQIHIICHARRQDTHQLTGVHDHLTLADVGQVLVQHPLNAFQNAGLPVNNGLLAGDAVLQGRTGGEGAQTFGNVSTSRGSSAASNPPALLIAVQTVTL